MSWLRANWVEVRYRLVVLAIAALVLTVFVGALRGSIHAGSTPPYNPPEFHPFVGQVLAWQAGTSALGGWAESHLHIDCPSLVVWVDAAPARGMVGIGPVAAGQRVAWAGQTIDAHGRPVVLRAPPKPAFVCYW